MDDDVTATVGSTRVRATVGGIRRNSVTVPKRVVKMAQGKNATGRVTASRSASASGGGRIRATISRVGAPKAKAAKVGPRVQLAQKIAADAMKRLKASRGMGGGGSGH